MNTPGSRIAAALESFAVQFEGYGDLVYAARCRNLSSRLTNLLQSVHERLRLAESELNHGSRHDAAADVAVAADALDANA